MKFRKLMKRVQGYFDQNQRQRRKQRKDIKHCLKKLRKKQKHLEEKLLLSKHPDEQQELKDKIALLKQQRQKLLTVLSNDAT
ncbi:hypothetical protein CHH28_02030 [Bacterioplanes sanyensis]|uniref:Uncharacterized protein n=1 Tax=Bacterioplanes sanyensis TaxID=1249553 RepID=A0A222FEL0_9GAMM|nr:hypothetical protein [Bacterioplanes sanyensis]ASP37525.1 hypothetical protein CHH28_02030 [Bacterioplanes sanyensis]